MTSICIRSTFCSAQRRRGPTLATWANSVVRPLLTHTVPWALVPALCWYYGVTQVGWQFGQEPR